MTKYSKLSSLFCGWQTNHSTHGNCGGWPPPFISQEDLKKHFGIKEERTKVEEIKVRDSRPRLRAAFPGRSEVTLELLDHFEFGHMPPELREISSQSAALAVNMIGELPDGFQLQAGLQSLLFAKDCFVRARVKQLRPPEQQMEPVPDSLLR